MALLATTQMLTLPKMPMIDLLLITAPFTYTYGPSLSPALLKACAEKNNIKSCTWDLSAEFNYNHNHTKSYKNITAWMRSSELTLCSEDYTWYQTVVREYADKIVNHYQPTVLAISLLTQNSQRFTEDLCYQIKLSNPAIKIILGGSGLDILQHLFNTKWHDLMLDSGLADTVILGEGEYALPRAINQNLTGLIKEPSLTSDLLDQVPIPNYDDYDFSLYQNSTKTYWSLDGDPKDKNELIFLITASKGCVKNCSFCDVGKIWPTFRFRSAEKVADEIISLHKKYNAVYFNFTDSLMNGGLKVFYELNNILATRLPKTIKYEGQIICRSQQEMPERYFKAMADAGCARVAIGMESGSEQVRMHMGKGSRQSDVYYTTEMLSKYGINQTWNIIAGYPTETHSDWQQTMKLIQYHLPRSNGLLTINPIDTFMMLQGTPINDDHHYNDLKIKHHIVNGYSSFAWTVDSNPTNTYDVRAARFIELCNYLIEYDHSQYHALYNKIENTKKHLDWYHNETKPKKIFNIVAN
jgi:radical SAM superfamily enzyme YgiQ (UPF0313 family)